MVIQNLLLITIKMNVFSFWGSVLGLGLPIIFAGIITIWDSMSNRGGGDYRPYLFQSLWAIFSGIYIYGAIYLKGSEFFNITLLNTVLIVNIIVTAGLAIYFSITIYLYKTGYLKRKEQEEARKESARQLSNYTYGSGNSSNNDSYNEVPEYENNFNDSSSNESEFNDSDVGSCHFACKVVALKDASVLGMNWPTNETIFTIHKDWSVSTKHDSSFGWIDVNGKIHEGYGSFNPNETLAGNIVAEISGSRCYDSDGDEIGKCW